MEITKACYNGTETVFELQFDHDMHVTYDGCNFKVTMLRDELEELHQVTRKEVLHNS